MQASRTASLLARVESLASAGWRQLATPVHAAYPHSAPGRLASGAARATRHSFVYRWLTTEPDPEVVVIDLRETWTVGPVIAALDWLGSTGPVRRVSSALATVGADVAGAVRSAPVRLAGVAVLAFAITTLALSWGSASTVGRIAWVAVAGLAALGLRVDASWSDLANSRLGAALRAVFEPPDLEDRENGPR